MGATLEVVEVQTHFVAALLPPTSPPASSQSPADSMLVDEDCLFFIFLFKGCLVSSAYLLRS